MHIAIHILNKILQYVCVGILHIQLDLYTEKKVLFNIISLSRMSEHISKSELFCNKRNNVKSSTLHQNITILEMSCEYKKICGYEADQCHAYLKKIIYIYVLVQIISLLL